ncbi:c-type cytochrome [Pollutimonas bauzanensis]|uniref:c-type cytochrome n=1 Tax=Pollutimonas bauzanensis TaxID=658167 RepID=UPI0033421D48
MYSTYSRFFLILSCLISLGFGGAASGQTTGVDLARTSNCLACHQIDQKRVGPSFTLIAQRFVNQEGASEYLANAIRQGGRGRWGAVPMPAQPQVNPANARLIAAWILSLADKNLPETK